MTPAHLYARLSELAYDARPAGRLSHFGFRLVARYDVDGTQAILVADDESLDPRVVLAFPGTAELRDWITDLRYVKTPFPGGGRVHLGFYRAFEKVWPHIVADLIRFSCPKVYTGHSLGAALALLAAADLPPQAVHVYGCPRVGNGAFVERLTCPVHRYENWLDFVPSVPPATSPVQVVHAWINGRWPTLYRHPGVAVRTPGVGHRIGRYWTATRGAGVLGD